MFNNKSLVLQAQTQNQFLSPNWAYLSAQRREGGEMKDGERWRKQDGDRAQVAFLRVLVCWSGCAVTSLLSLFPRFCPSLLILCLSLSLSLSFHLLFLCLPIALSPQQPYWLQTDCTKCVFKQWRRQSEADSQDYMAFNLLLLCILNQEHRGKWQ